MEQDMGEHVDAIFTGNSQIVCSKCRYFVEDAIAECAHPHARMVILTWKGEEVQYVSPVLRNAANDCLDFCAETLGDQIRKRPLTLLTWFVGSMVGLIGLCYAGLRGIHALLVR